MGTMQKVLTEGGKYRVYTVSTCVKTGHRHDNCPSRKKAFYNELQLLNELGEKTPGNLYQCNCCGKIIR